MHNEQEEPGLLVGKATKNSKGFLLCDGPWTQAWYCLNCRKTRTKKMEALIRYSKVTTEVEQSIRKDPRNLQDKKRMAAGKGDVKELYSITGTLAGVRKITNRPVWAESGEVLIDQEKQRRWAEHFRILLVIFQKRVRVFHRGFKHDKTDESTRPLMSRCYLACLSVLSKHVASQSK